MVASPPMPYPLLPGPRAGAAPSHSISFPPPQHLPAFWHRGPASSASLPVGQSRNDIGGGYISPDISPTAIDPPPPLTYDGAAAAPGRHVPRYSPHVPFDASPSGLLPLQQAKQSWPQQASFPPYHGGMAGDADPYYRPESTHSREPKKKNVGGKKNADGKQATFLTKLYGILAQPEYQHIIRWDDKGELIIIERPDELAEKILPMVYRQSRFASFSRQLNIYGFMRKVSLRHVERGICDPDASTWSHPFLNRDSPHSELVNFKRRVPPRPSQAKRRLSTAVPHDGTSPSSVSDGSHPSPPDLYQPHLLGDLEEGMPATFSTSLPHIYTQLGAQPPLMTSPPDSDASDFWDETRQLVAQRMSLSRPIDQPPLFDPFALVENEGQTMGVPQSAPAHTAHFPMPQHLVRQNHLRTRSVQGEPPSATMFSPIAPQAWQPEAIRYEHDPADASQRGASGAATYDPNDAGTWASDLTGIPAFFAASSDRLGATPSSLPRDFAPGSGSHINNNSSSSKPSNLRLMGFPELFAQHHHASGMNQYPTSPSSASTPPGTISPGIYQTGFRPSYQPTPDLVGPERTSKPIARQEPRASISTSPYFSPKSTRPAALSLERSATRVSDGGKVSTGRQGSVRRDVTKKDEDKDEDEDEASLPSGGLKGFHDGFPFEKVLQASQGLMHE